MRLQGHAAFIGKRRNEQKCCSEDFRKGDSLPLSAYIR
jgi:hypothetical protein